MITSIFPTICTDDVSATAAFYRDLFGFEDNFAADWYVQLQDPSKPELQIGIVDRNHESVPADFRLLPAGFLLAIEVADVDALHRRMVEAGVPMALELRNETWGQRHFIAVDPSGVLVDVITPIPPTAEYADAYLVNSGD